MSEDLQLCNLDKCEKYENWEERTAAENLRNETGENEGKQQGKRVKAKQRMAYFFKKQ